MIGLSSYSSDLNGDKAKTYDALQSHASSDLSETSNAEIVEDAPLYFALLLGNQNNNNGRNGANPPPNTKDKPEEIVVPTMRTLELQVPEVQPLKLRLRAALRQESEPTPTIPQTQEWKQNGYMVIPNALSTDEVANLMRAVEEHIQRLFSPKEEVKVHSYLPGQVAYTLPCGRSLATLTEVNAVRLESSTYSPMQRVQRIGCAAHLHFPSIQQVVHSHRNARIAKSLGLQDPMIVDCTILTKSAGTGRKIGSHQEGGSLYNGPVASGVTFWYALQDSTIENGCLEVARGTHRLEPIRTRTVLGNYGMPRNVELDEPVYAGLDELDPSTLPKKNESGEYEFTKLPVKAGTLIVMHQNLIHTSSANKSKSNRMAMKFSIVDGQHGWPHDNYLQPGRERGFEKLQGLY